MLLAGEKLAPFTLTYYGVGVKHGGGPEEPLLIRLTHE
jgi:hypothetical protein